MITQINPGTLINNRYLIQKILGQGGFGRTYLAFDNQRFDEACVLKEFVPTTTKIDIIRKSRELFEREAKVLYQIQHPQIPKFLACLTENESLFIVQEYIDGKNYSEILSERLSQKGKPFSESEIRTWLLDMLPVLEYIHDRQIIHRDISLDNIMLPHNQSKPVLIDFGVVKEKFTYILAVDSLNPQYCVPGSVVGKIGYSPPEQIRLGQCYPSSDLYALAVSAVILLTGKMPHSLMDNSLNWQWRSYVNISDSLACILDKMLAEVPTERYQSAKQVILELNNNFQAVSSGFFARFLPKNAPNNTLPQKQQSVNHKDLEELSILQQLEQKLRGKSDTTKELYPPAPVSFNPQFVEYVGRELTSFVGPLAGVLVKHTLVKSPEITAEEFIKVLANAIPNVELAQDFRNHIQVSSEFSLAKLPSFINLPETWVSYPAISNPEFLENCRRELTTFVGPLASVVLKKTLEHQPNITPKQLIETLVAEIPTQQEAEEFKRRIHKLSIS